MESSLRRMPTAGPIKLDSGVALLVRSALFKEHQMTTRPCADPREVLFVAADILVLTVVKFRKSND
jgi:hypothetical protein